MRQEYIRRLSSPGPEQAPLWRLERKIPLTLAAALIGQGIGLVIWATHLEARVDAVEHTQAEQTGLNEKFARLEERIDALRGDITRLGRQVEKLTYRRQ